MTVFVDQLARVPGPGNRSLCRLWADTLAELLEMAERVGEMVPDSL